MIRESFLEEQPFIWVLKKIGLQMNEVGEGILDRDQGLKDYSAKNSMACSEGTE